MVISLGTEIGGNAFKCYNKVQAILQLVTNWEPPTQNDGFGYLGTMDSSSTSQSTRLNIDMPLLEGHLEKEVFHLLNIITPYTQMTNRPMSTML